MHVFLFLVRKSFPMFFSLDTRVHSIHPHITYPSPIWMNILHVLVKAKEMEKVIMVAVVVEITILLVTCRER